MHDVFEGEACDPLRSSRRLSARRHVPNFQQAVWIMERDRERAVRFSNLEIEVLVDLIKSHIIVEARNVDCTTNVEKRKAWENITTEFWTRTSSNRTEYQLLKKWKNLKHAARKYEAAINSKEHAASGRGPPPRSPIFEEVLDVMRREQEAMKSNRHADTTMCVPTKIKIEQEDSYGNAVVLTNPLGPERNGNWEQEDCFLPREEVSVDNHLQPMEHMSVESQQFDSNRQPSQSNENERRIRAVDAEEDSSDDAISVGGCSVVSQRTQAIDSSVPPESQHSKKNSTDESSNLTYLVQKKALALKSAQLALVAKENKIKDLDIRIREEQLADILIRRKHEQQLHELRKKRMLRGLSEG